MGSKSANNLMNKRLYYADPYKKSFEASVRERFFIKDQFAVVLDSTIFYPTSGGQPHDLGFLNGAEVTGVFVRDSDQEVIHLLEREVEGDSISGSINWKRRFDHMQQHSGQHLLSRAFSNLCEANTISFHLGTEVCTIDLDIPELDEKRIDAVELMANQIIWDNRPIKSYEVSQEEALELALRKVPEEIGDRYRVIDIRDYDLCACGGTHVFTTGEIGLIKITGKERRNNNLRIEFVCGQRAFSDYYQKNRILKSIASRLTTGYTEIERVVELIQDENKNLQRKIKSLSNALLSLEASSLMETAIPLGDILLIKNVRSDENPENLRTLASKITQEPSLVTLLGTLGDRSFFVFASSEDIDLDMKQLLQQVFAFLGNGKGGGTVKFAQGGGAKMEEGQMVAALNHAEDLLRESYHN